MREISYQEHTARRRVYEEAVKLSACCLTMLKADRTPKRKDFALYTHLLDRVQDELHEYLSALNAAAIEREYDAIALNRRGRGEVRKDKEPEGSLSLSV